MLSLFQPFLIPAPTTHAIGLFAFPLLLWPLARALRFGNKLHLLSCEDCGGHGLPSSGSTSSASVPTIPPTTPLLCSSSCQCSACLLFHSGAAGQSSASVDACWLFKQYSNTMATASDTHAALSLPPLLCAPLRYQLTPQY